MAEASIEDVAADQATPLEELTEPESQDAVAEVVEVSTQVAAIVISEESEPEDAAIAAFELEDNAAAEVEDATEQLVAESAEAESLEATSAEVESLEIENVEIESVEIESVETVSELSVADAIQLSVQAWVDAWQAQSLSDYFTYYHPEFAPRYQNSQSEWRANRQRVIGNADWIRLNMRDFELIAEEGGVYEVHFWLAYESPTYSDDTLKKLLVRKEGEDWLILEEINLRVES